MDSTARGQPVEAHGPGHHHDQEATMRTAGRCRRTPVAPGRGRLHLEGGAAWS